MNKLASLNIIGILVTALMVFYVTYYFLLQDTFLPISISSIITHATHLEIKKHILVLGLLPFYIAAMIFGAGLLGIYLGSALQHFIMRCSKKAPEHG